MTVPSPLDNPGIKANPQKVERIFCKGCNKPVTLLESASTIDPHWIALCGNCRREALEKQMEADRLAQLQAEKAKNPVAISCPQCGEVIFKAIEIIRDNPFSVSIICGKCFSESNARWKLAFDRASQSSIVNLQNDIHAIAKNKGWWEEGKEQSFGEFIALCHAELSEALEEHRNGYAEDQTYYPEHSDPSCPKGLATRIFSIFAMDIDSVESPCTCKPGTNKPEGIPTELADVIIRILDRFGRNNIDVAKVLQAKIAYNKIRPYRHGGKKL